LLRAAPETFSTTPHYDGHPIVLVDVSVTDVDELRELIVESWRQRAPHRLRQAFDERQRGSSGQ
jgi:hypothetical protein